MVADFLTEKFENKNGKLVKVETDYLDAIKDFEQKIEKSLIKTFGKVDIHASVKTDRYSLPYQDEIVVTLNGESYMNGAFEIFRVARPIMKAMLEKNAYKIRFYMYVNALEGNMGFGKMEYRFRYFIH
jgi:hypothetical protein